MLFKMFISYYTGINVIIKQGIVLFTLALLIQYVCATFRDRCCKFKIILFVRRETGSRGIAASKCAPFTNPS
jgi:hypothetical protein